MPVGIRCGNCGQQYQVSEAVAGKRVRCRHCGAAIPVPGPAPPPSRTSAPAPAPAPLLPPAPPPMLSPPMLSPPVQPMRGLYQTPAQSWQWGGAYAPAGGSSRGINPLLVVAMVFSLGWAGYVLYEALRQIDAISTVIDRARGGIPLTLVLVLLLRLVQVLCAGGVVMGMGAVLARQSWGTVVGTISAGVYFGMSWTWVPMIHPSLALAFGFVQQQRLRASQVILRTGLDIVLQLIVPAVALVVLAQLDPRTSRRREWPCSRMLVGAGTLGWSVYALIASWGVVDGLLTALDMADHLNAADRLTASFWTMLLLRIGCLLAAVGLAVASVGILLRQEWSLTTGLMCTGGYLALTLVIVVLAISRLAGAAEPAMASSSGLFLVTHVAKEMLVPACALGYCMWAQNADW